LRYWTLKNVMTLKSGSKVTQSYQKPGPILRDRQQFQSKIAKFSHPVHFAPPLTGFPFDRRRGQNIAMMGLPDSPKSFKIGLKV